MALSLVPVRVWSCPNHEEPVSHDCDCQFCTWEQPECCQNARWVDKTDATGAVVMREVGVWEEMMIHGLVETGEIEWAEDERLPEIKACD